MPLVIYLAFAHNEVKPALDQENNMLKITILTENSVRKPGLLAEHGLSLWLEMPGSRTLFDAGQSDVFHHNAKELGIDLGQADNLVLSHGHYDHGNGFMHFPISGSFPRFISHPGAFAPRYALDKPGGEERPVGLAWQPEDLPWLAGRIQYNTGRFALSENAWLFCRLAEAAPEARPSPGFLREDQGKKKPDLFLDEQILVVRQENGLVIICGCCHPGLLTSVNYIRGLFPDQPVQALLGGFHLGRATAAELADLARALQEISLKLIIPLHCTGPGASCFLKQVFSDSCLWLRTGDTISFS